MSTPKLSGMGDNRIDRTTEERQVSGSDKLDLSTRARVFETLKKLGYLASQVAVGALLVYGLCKGAKSITKAIAKDQAEGAYPLTSLSVIAIGVFMLSKFY